MPRDGTLLQPHAKDPRLVAIDALIAAYPDQKRWCQGNWHKKDGATCPLKRIRNLNVADLLVFRVAAAIPRVTGKRYRLDSFCVYICERKVHSLDEAIIIAFNDHRRTTFELMMKVLHSVREGIIIDIRQETMHAGQMVVRELVGA